MMRLLLLKALMLASCDSLLFIKPTPKKQETGRISFRSDVTPLFGWVQQDDGEWEWEEDDDSYVPPPATTTTATTIMAETSATPRLPSGSYKPKQSLGQNYLKDPNTVSKILRAFHQDATRDKATTDRIIELGPGAGALTDKLVETYGTDILQCIEIDPRSVELLNNKHPNLDVIHEDVLQVNYPQMAQQHDNNDGDTKNPLVVIGNLPYYITSQILFALADASHSGSIYSATVTMQWEVAQRMVAKTNTKDYGILSVVFQLYCDVNCHFKIPPTVFYPQPKVDSALVGLHFVGPDVLRNRLAGVRPVDLRRVVTTAFRQRRKTIRNSLKKLCKEIFEGDTEKFQTLFGESSPPPLPDSVAQAAAQDEECFAATQQLPHDWSSKRPEQLTAGQFIELTRLLFGPGEGTIDETVPLGNKVWRKLKHGE